MAPFYHRRELGGLYVSFCVVCFQTVAREAMESDLARGEEAHKCEGAPLAIPVPQDRAV